MSDDLKHIIEAVMLVSDSPVSVARIQGLFDEDVKPEAADVNRAISSLQADCEERGVELKKSTVVIAIRLERSTRTT